MHLDMRNISRAGRRPAGKACPRSRIATRAVWGDRCKTHDHRIGVPNCYHWRSRRIVPSTLLKPRSGQLERWKILRISAIFAARRGLRPVPSRELRTDIRADSIYNALTYRHQVHKAHRTNWDNLFDLSLPGKPLSVTAATFSQSNRSRLKL
jgi:hypothetical protein